MDRLLPVRVLPQPDELLSSWFIRLAHANGEKAQSLAFRIWGRAHRFIGTNDPDRGERKVILEGLAKATGLHLNQIIDMTLAGYKGLLWNEISSRGSRRWIMPIMDRHHHRGGFGLQACPVCLKTDEQPYFRRSWRLSLHCVCLEHNVMLLDRCQECSAPITIHRGDIGTFVPSEGISPRYCPHCNADHAEVKPPQVKDLAAMDFQWLILACLRRGWINVGGRVIHSALFFEGLRMLWSFLDAPQWSRPLRRHLNDCNAFQSHDGPKVHRYGGFDVATVGERYELLRATTWLFQDWPKQFVSAMRAADLASSSLLHFKRVAEAVPFWLWEPTHIHLDKTMYVPDAREIYAAVMYLNNSSGHPRVRDVCQLLNMRARFSRRVLAVVNHAINDQLKQSR